MAGSDDFDKAMAGEGSKTKILVAAAELGRRRHELHERIKRLEEERSALQEIRESLIGEEEILAKRRAAAERDRRRIAVDLDSNTQRVMETMEQIEKLKREISILERRCQESKARDKELTKEIAAAEKSLSNAKMQIFNVDQALETGRAALARMDRKISLSKMKR